MEILDLRVLRGVQAAVDRVSRETGKDYRITNYDGMGSASQVYRLVTSGQLLQGFVKYLDSLDNPSLSGALDFLANIGETTRMSYHAFRVGCLHLGRSFNLRDSVVCLILGYLSVAAGVVIARTIRIGGPPQEERLKRWTMFIKVCLDVAIDHLR